jgi:hypothetical protein
MWAVEVAVSVPKYGEELALKVYVLPEDVMARGPLAEVELRQLVHASVCVFWFHERGEETVAELSVVPLPERSPPKVVEAVPPLATVRALVREREVMLAVPATVRS